MSVRVGKASEARPFQEAARDSLENSQLRHNIRHATNVIRDKRGSIVGEMPDWQQLRDAGSAIKSHVMRNLDLYLEQFERNMTKAGGHVHWAADAGEARTIIRELIEQHGGREVIKVKTMTSEEIELNPELTAHGIQPYETDLAELIIQLGEGQSSHFVVPALHINHLQIQQIFKSKMPLREMGMSDLGETPPELAEAARRYLREKFLRVKVGVSGANFAIAETGSLVVVESEGNGRMCLTLPEVLISVVGIEKIIPTFQDLEVFFSMLARSATGERMSPYTSIWTGVDPNDGPKEVHVVLLDNGRTRVLQDDEGRQALNCIRCAACLNACPVYQRTGGHAYGAVYAGPIGAILMPQLQAMEHSQSLPYASSLCGACYEACPMQINIPEVLIRLRSRIVEEKKTHLSGKLGAENLAMSTMRRIFQSERLLRAAHRLARMGQRPFVERNMVPHLPGLKAWSETRDLRAIPKQSFRDWWREREKQRKAGGKG
ncbi:MAG: iron-sulfur cluster-binding protein [Acidobacteriia bacterium]|nr:iron-sulfur cluster-binding protein [Terriglobia bacterium]